MLLAHPFQQSAKNIEKTNLLRYVSEIHNIRAIASAELVEPQFEANFVNFLHDQGINEKTDDWADLWGPQLILACLEKAGLLNVPVGFRIFCWTVLILFTGPGNHCYS